MCVCLVGLAEAGRCRHGVGTCAYLLRVDELKADGGEFLGSVECVPSHFCSVMRWN